MSEVIQLSINIDDDNLTDVKELIKKYSNVNLLELINEYRKDKTIINPNDIGRLSLYIGGLIYKYKSGKEYDKYVKLLNDVNNIGDNLSGEDFKIFYEYMGIGRFLTEASKKTVYDSYKIDSYFFNIMSDINLWESAEKDYILFAINNIKLDVFTNRDNWHYDYISENFIKNNKYNLYQTIKEFKNAILEVNETVETVNILSKMYKIPSLKYMVLPPQKNLVNDFNKLVDLIKQNIRRVNLFDNELSKDEIIKELDTFLMKIKRNEINPTKKRKDTARERLKLYNFGVFCDVESFIKYIWSWE